MDDATRIRAEKQRTLEWVNEKWAGDKKCPICTTQNWAIEGVVEMRPYHGGALVMGSGGTFPAAQVICANCGYTHFFNAVLSGIVVASDYEGSTEVG